MYSCFSCNIRGPKTLVIVRRRRHIALNNVWKANVGDSIPSRETIGILDHVGNKRNLHC